MGLQSPEVMASSLKRIIWKQSGILSERSLDGGSWSSFVNTPIEPVSESIWPLKQEQCGPAPETTPSFLTTPSHCFILMSFRCKWKRPKLHIFRLCHHGKEDSKCNGFRVNKLDLQHDIRMAATTLFDMSFATFLHPKTWCYLCLPDCAGKTMVWNTVLVAAWLAVQRCKVLFLH